MSAHNLTTNRQVPIHFHGSCADGIRKAKEQQDVSFLVGFETEVVFLEDGAFPPVPISNHAWSTSLSMRSSGVGKALVEEIYDVLTDAGIEVQQFHAESAPGQYEVVTGPLAPVEAVDALVFTRDTIYNVAARYGVRATLYPKVFKDACTYWVSNEADRRWNGGSRPCIIEARDSVSCCECSGCAWSECFGNRIHCWINGSFTSCFCICYADIRILPTTYGWSMGCTPLLRGSDSRVERSSAGEWRIGSRPFTWMITDLVEKLPFELVLETIQENTISR